MDWGGSLRSFDEGTRKSKQSDDLWSQSSSLSDSAVHIDSLNLGEEEDDVIVIGIDFGTTYSGVAYATLSEFQDEQISLITEWPECGQEEGKAPTQLFYEHDEISWGYALPPDADPISWFKLLLLKDEDLDESIKSSEFILRAKKKVRSEGRRPVDMVADYLRLLWGHTLEIIEKSRGKDVIDAMRFHVVITVPAIWKGYARQSMEEAAQKAGILAHREIGETQLSFVLEPEAAGMATLIEHKRLVQPGDVWLICDAGGGTVDLISYKISSKNPITMDEAVEGIGGLCGGVLIDDAFEAICKARLGRRWEHLSPNGVKEIMSKGWERSYKRQFKPTNDPDKEYIVSIPAEAFEKTGVDDTSKLPHIKKGRIHFKGSDIQKAFIESFSRIDKLVDEQIMKAKQKNISLRGIILVGGLGSSPYLYQHLKDRHTNAGIIVLQSTGMKPRTAICHGAVYKGFLEDQNMGDDDNGLSMKTLNIPAPISVMSTISRYSLGTIYYKNFDPTKHAKSDPDYMWFSDEGDYVINNQMRWYIRKGDNVSKTDPVRHSWVRRLRRDFKGSFTDNLFQCASSSPPPRCNDTVQRLCGMKCTPDIDMSSLDDFTTADGKKKLKTLSYDLEMVPSGASMEFSFYIDSRKQGSHNIKVEYE